jgi:hypothetical protein
VSGSLHLATSGCHNFAVGRALVSIGNLPKAEEPREEGKHEMNRRECLSALLCTTACTVLGCSHARMSDKGGNKVNHDDLSLAVCGIDCSGCEIRRATADRNLAAAIAKRLDEPIEKVQCVGCRGKRERGKHWTSTCWILSCCIDEKHHDNCSECEIFPCARLEEWAAKAEKYGIALRRLKQLRESSAKT